MSSQKVSKIVATTREEFITAAKGEEYEREINSLMDHRLRTDAELLTNLLRQHLRVVRSRYMTRINTMSFIVGTASFAATLIGLTQVGG